MGMLVFLCVFILGSSFGDAVWSTTFPMFITPCMPTSTEIMLLSEALLGIVIIRACYSFFSPDGWLFLFVNIYSILLIIHAPGFSKTLAKKRENMQRSL